MTTLRLLELLHRYETDDRGQTTAEYALVLSVAAVIVTVFLAWAVTGGKLEGLFDAVYSQLTGVVGGGG